MLVSSTDNSKESTRTLSGRFLRNWLLTLVVLSTSLLLFEILMDPYLLFNTPRLVRINLRKPAAETQLRLMRAYDVLRAKPASIILGSSRAAWGLDGDDESWPAETRPVYNLAFPYGSPGDAYQYLRYVLSIRPLSFAIMGLEFSYFLQQDPAQDIYHPHQILAVQTSSRQAQREYLQDVLNFSVSLGALTDSSQELLSNLTDPSWNLDGGGWRFNAFQQAAQRMDPSTVFALTDVYLLRWYRGRRGSSEGIWDIERILELCRSHHTRVILFISPLHADELELLHIVGLWPAFDNWKRQLVSLMARYDPQGSLVQIWDFSNYDAYSTEPPDGGQHPMRWFFSTDHYTRATGTMIVQRLFGKGDPDFGERLTTENVEAHLARINEAREQYIERSSAEVHRLRSLVAVAP